MSNPNHKNDVSWDNVRHLHEWKEELKQQEEEEFQRSLLHPTHFMDLFVTASFNPHKLEGADKEESYVLPFTLELELDLSERSKATTVKKLEDLIAAIQGDRLPGWAFQEWLADCFKNGDLKRKEKEYEDPERETWKRYLNGTGPMPPLTTGPNRNKTTCDNPMDKIQDAPGSPGDGEMQ